MISVIIPTFRDWARLQTCLDALTDQSFPPHRFEVIVVNNDPSDPPQSWDQADNVTLIEEARPGSYAARNAGVRIASGVILAFTDSDCIPDRRWLEEGAKALERSPSAGRVAGAIQLFYESDVPTSAEVFDTMFGFDQEYSARNGGSVTANMFVRRDVFDQVGEFDEKLMSGGDTEWSYRAKVQGVAIVYSSTCLVKHPARRTFSELIKKRRRLIGGRVSRGRVSRAERFWWLKGFVPPVFAVRTIASQKAFSVLQRASVFFMLYYLKLDATVFRLLLNGGLAKTPRQ